MNRKISVLAIIITALSITCVGWSGEPEVKLRMIDGLSTFPSKVVKKVPIPKGYHEGLLLEGGDIWVTNGKNGVIWVMDTNTNFVKREITPVAGFTEGITKIPDGTYVMADWDQKKLYRTRMVESRLVAVGEASVAPAHPAGVVWNGSKLYVILWTRGMGTKFEIVEMDIKFTILKRIEIDRIQEPAHIAWDGRYIWMTSWYSNYIYKVDPASWTALGQVRSPVSKTTGVAWDGKSLWVTGTYSDLYQIELT